MTVSPLKASPSPTGLSQRSSVAPRVGHPISLPRPLAHAPSLTLAKMPPGDIWYQFSLLCLFLLFFQANSMPFTPHHRLTSHSIPKFQLVHILTRHQGLDQLMPTELKIDNVNPRWTVSYLFGVFYWSALESVFLGERDPCLSPEPWSGPGAGWACGRVVGAQLKAECWLLLSPYPHAIYHSGLNTTSHIEPGSCLLAEARAVNGQHLIHNFPNKWLNIRCLWKPSLPPSSPDSFFQLYWCVIDK